MINRGKQGKNNDPSEAAHAIGSVDREWQDRVRGMLRAELARRNLNYVELAERLRSIGIIDNPKNLSNKIARGMFTAAFFMQCMAAIDCRIIRLQSKDQ